MNRISKMMYSARLGYTVLLMADGRNYVLAEERDPVKIAQFCNSARQDTWKWSLKPEGMEIIMKQKDLIVQDMSF